MKAAVFVENTEYFFGLSCAGFGYRARLGISSVEL